MKNLLTTQGIGLMVALLLFACNDDETTEVPEIIVEAEIIDASAFGSSDGGVNISVTGGAEPFNYFWKPLSSQAIITTDKDLSGQSAGVYELTIIFGENGAGSHYSAYTIGQPEQDELIVPFEVTDATYPTAKDGLITIDVANITGGEAPYTFSWSDGPSQSFRAGLFAGIYSLTVTDANTVFPRITTLDIMVGEPEFLCGRDSIIDVEGNRYATVDIAGECWISQNLKVEHYADGRAINGVNCFENSCTSIRGGYYSWDALVDAGNESESENVQGVCPDGWHVPSKEEWQLLNDTLKTDGIGGSGTVVKDKVIGNNSSSGLDLGYYGFFGFTNELQQNESIFWSSSDIDTGDPNTTSATATYFRIRPSGFDTEFRSGDVLKTTGINCRCIQNKEEE